MLIGNFHRSTIKVTNVFLGVGLHGNIYRTNDITVVVRFVITMLHTIVQCVSTISLLVLCCFRLSLVITVSGIYVYAWVIAMGTISVLILILCCHFCWVVVWSIPSSRQKKLRLHDFEYCFSAKRCFSVDWLTYSYAQLCHFAWQNSAIGISSSYFDDYIWWHVEIVTMWFYSSAVL